MNKFNIFILRIIMGAVFGVIVMRFFYPDTHFIYSMGLGAFLVMMAYFMENLGSSKKSKK